MTDYKDNLPHHRERNISTVVSAILLVLILAWISRCLVDAVVQTAEIQERYYSKPVTATYSRPAAFRKASPTQEQMDHLHGLMAVQEVNR